MRASKVAFFCSNFAWYNLLESDIRAAISDRSQKNGDGSGEKQ
jgi:hypothetical protein